MRCIRRGRGLIGIGAFGVVVWDLRLGLTLEEIDRMSLGLRRGGRSLERRGRKRSFLGLIVGLLRRRTWVRRVRMLTCLVVGMRGLRVDIDCSKADYADALVYRLQIVTASWSFLTASCSCLLDLHLS